MTKRKHSSLGVGILALFVCIGCGGGGGAGSLTGPTHAANLTMKNVNPPANTGKEGGFIYASFQDVHIDVTVPSANQLVNVFLQAVDSSLYDAAGNVVTPEQPVLLAQGQSSTSAVDGKNHFTHTLSLPTSVTSLYVVPGVGLYPSSSTVSISKGQVKCEFKGVE